MAPLSQLLSELQEARSNADSSEIDISRVITLVESTICCVGQTSLEAKFQRRINLVGSLLSDWKTAKTLVKANGEVMEKSQRDLCGEVFTARLLKKLKRPIPEDVCGKVAVATVKALNYLKVLSLTQFFSVSF